jgi:hypothetical protein
MRHIGLFTFGITTCVLVPAALDQLVAGPKQVAKLSAPSTSKMQLGDTTIDVTSDRTLVPAGGTLRVKLTASAPRARTTTVELVVLESVGTDGGRVEAPPNQVGWESVTLDARPGGASKEVALTLRGHTGQDYGEHRFNHYTILVMEPNKADKLARTLRKEQPKRRNWGAGQEVEAWDALYKPLGGNSDDGDPQNTDSRVARLDVVTHAKSPIIKLAAPERVRSDEAFDVPVTVTNPFDKPIDKLGIVLETNTDIGLRGYSGLDDGSVTFASDNSKGETISLAPHETKTVVFRIAASGTGTLGLFAYENTYEFRNDPGALEAVEITEREPATPTVASTH